VAAQIAQCGLTALDAHPQPVVHDIEFSNGVSSERYVLFNRTAGECFCTVPVLDRLDACYQCMASVDSPDGNGPVSGTAQDYLQDCGDLGYFPDRNLVVYHTSSSTSRLDLSTIPPTGTSSTPGATGSAGGAKNHGVGLTSQAKISIRWGMAVVVACIAVV
jgi:hypothetical protein